MDVKIDHQSTLTLRSFNIGITKFTPVTDEELVKWVPQSIIDGFRELGYTVLRVEEKI